MAETKKGNGKGNGQWVGQRFKRKEDPRLIQGISHYVDDIRLPGLLYCAFVRSPHANARLTSVNLEAAKAAPGVVAVFTHADLTGVGSIPCAGSLPGLKIPYHPALAKEQVRYVGEPVVAIVAENAYQAR